MSQPYAEVIGDPIAHSKSPLIHNFWLGKLGIDADYRACHMRAEELADYFARKRGDAEWRGCNITVPHKEAATHFIDSLLPGYQDIGAINLAICRGGALLGGNTDLDGVIGPINRYHETIFNFGKVPPRKVGIIGAGGAARAAVAALKAAGWVDEWRIAVRRPDRGQALLTAFGLEGTIIPIADQHFSGLDIVINASTMGMGEIEDSALKLDQLADRAVLFDMVYSPLETGLIRAAREQGLAVIGGLEMLIEQAASAFYHFFGQAAPRKFDTELSALLTV
jgi:shikimate dehydrogenase